jgi:hypothetical protein
VIRAALTFRSVELRRAALALSLALVPRAAAAQAYIPVKGEGTVSASYQAVFTRWQMNSTGQRLFPDNTDTHALISQIEYGLADRLAVHASLPFMAVRYAGGPNPHTLGVNGQPSTIDDGTYHGSFQDFYFGVRFGAIQTPRFALAPFAEGILPSHHYESLGQSVVGRDLRALVVGAAVGGFVEKALPGLFFQTRVSYAFVQQAVEIRPNRTGIDSAVGYFVNPRFAVQFVQTFVHTHNGVDFNGTTDTFTATVSNGAPFTFEHYLNHDRLIRSRVVTLGGGMTYALTDSVGVYATATTMAWGADIQRPAVALTAGVNWGFRTPGSGTPKPNLKVLP